MVLLVVIVELVCSSDWSVIIDSGGGVDVDVGDGYNYNNRDGMCDIGW